MLPLVLALFTRLDRSTLLGHAVRRGILDALRTAPGASVAAIATRFEVDYKTALYHVRMLERAGSIYVVRSGRSTTCYLTPRALGPPPERAVHALDAIREGAGTLSSISRVLGVPRANVEGLVEALEERGLVRREGSRFVASPRPPPSGSGEAFS